MIRRIAAALAGGITLMGATQAQAASTSGLTFRPFSADQTMVMNGKTTQSKVYVTADAIRTEGDKITIARLDKQVIWIVTPAAKTYIEMKLSGQMLAAFVESAKDAQIVRTPAGSEQVGSYNCDKYNVKITWQGNEYDSVEWDAKELGGFPVKSAATDGSWTKTYDNIKIGPQDPSLFTVPDDYRKIALPFSM